MTKKSPAKVTVLFSAVLPVGAWVAVVYFALVITESLGVMLDIVVRFLEQR